MNQEDTRKEAIEKLIKKHIEHTPSLHWIKMAVSLRKENPELTEAEKCKIALLRTINDKNLQIEFETNTKNKTVDSVVNFALNKNILPPLHIIEEFGVKPETAKRVIQAHMKDPKVTPAWIGSVISAMKTSVIADETVEMLIKWAIEGNYAGYVFKAIQLKKSPGLTTAQAQILLAKCIEQKDLPNAIKTAGFLNRTLTTEEIEQLLA